MTLTIHVGFEQKRTFENVLKQQPAPKNDTNDTKNDTKKLGMLSKRQNEILEHLRTQPSLTQASLSRMMGLSIATIKREFEYLKNNEIIKRNGPSNGGEWDIMINTD